MLNISYCALTPKARIQWTVVYMGLLLGCHLNLEQCISPNLLATQPSLDFSMCYGEGSGEVGVASVDYIFNCHENDRLGELMKLLLCFIKNIHKQFLITRSKSRVIVMASFKIPWSSLVEPGGVSSFINSFPWKGVMGGFAVSSCITTP